MAKRRRQRLTRGKARRIGKRRIIGNKSTSKQWSASKINGKRAMRVARRRSANRRRKGNGAYSNTTNYENEIPMSWVIIFTSGILSIHQYMNYIDTYYYPSLTISKVSLFVFIVTICIKIIVSKSTDNFEEEDKIKDDIIIEEALSEEQDK